MHRGSSQLGAARGPRGARSAMRSVLVALSLPALAQGQRPAVDGGTITRAGADGATLGAKTLPANSVSAFSLDVGAASAYGRPGNCPSSSSDCPDSASSYCLDSDGACSNGRCTCIEGGAPGGSYVKIDGWKCAATALPAPAPAPAHAGAKQRQGSAPGSAEPEEGPSPRSLREAGVPTAPAQLSAERARTDSAAAACCAAGSRSTSWSTHPASRRRSPRARATRSRTRRSTRSPSPSRAARRAP